MSTAEKELQSLASHRHDPDQLSLFYDSDGYYIHRNRVFLQGTVTNNADPGNPMDGILYTGVPDEIRPASTQTARVVLIAPDPATPGITVPTSTTMTITPGGQLSIPVPAYANEHPPGESYGSFLGAASAAAVAGTVPRPWFPDPFYYTIVLGNVSWLIGSEAGGSYDKESLAAYLGDGDFENIDATIGVHGARVHLAGHIRAKLSGAEFLTQTLPAKYLSAVDRGAGDHTTAKAPKFELSIQISDRGQLLVDNQDRPVPADDPTWIAPANLTSARGSPQFSGGRSGIAGLSTQQTRVVNSFGTMVPSNLPDSTFMSWGGPEPGGERVARGFVGSLNSGGDLTDYDGVYGGGTDVISHTRPGLYLDISDQVGAFNPPPAWVAVTLGWGFFDPLSITHVDGVSNPVIYPVSGVVEGDMDCAMVWGFNPADPSVTYPPLGAVTATLPVTQSIHGVDETTAGGTFDPASGVPSGIAEGGSGYGYLAPPNYPGASGYDGDPNNGGAALLWRPDAIPTSFMMTVGGGGQNWAEPRIGLEAWVIPFWPTRRHWIMQGDVIDLTGAGWQAPYTPPAAELIPGFAQAGPGTIGAIRSGKKHGRSTVSGRTPTPPPSGGNWSMDGLVGLALSVGVPTDQASTAGAIAMAESGGDPSNFLVDSDGSIDRGLWQINNAAHPDVSDACAYDPQCNAKAMFSISGGGTNWTPWTTYNTGAYLPFMAAAEQALAKYTSP